MPQSTGTARKQVPTRESDADVAWRIALAAARMSERMAAGGQPAAFALSGKGGLRPVGAGHGRSDRSIGAVGLQVGEGRSPPTGKAHCRHCSSPQHREERGCYTVIETGLVAACLEAARLAPSYLRS